MHNIIAGRGSSRAPITPERTATCSHVVPQRGLTRDNLGDAIFEEAFEERRAWLAEHCNSDHVIEPDREHGKLVGRDYRFEDDREAVFFKLTFGTFLGATFP